MDAILRCPKCGRVHLDIGEWASRPHTSHLCRDTPEGAGTGCGHEWVISNFTVRGVTPGGDIVLKGEFKLVSGAVEELKFEFDNLSDAAVEALAHAGSELLRHSEVTFREVVAVPTSDGCRFARAIEKYRRDDGRKILVVDDVMTTGGTLRRAIEERASRGDCEVEEGDFTCLVGVRRLSTDWNKRSATHVGHYSIIYVPERAPRTENIVCIYHPMTVYL